MRTVNLESRFNYYDIFRNRKSRNFSNLVPFPSFQTCHIFVRNRMYKCLCSIFFFNCYKCTLHLSWRIRCYWKKWFKRITKNTLKSYSLSSKFYYHFSKNNLSILFLQIINSSSQIWSMFFDVCRSQRYQFSSKEFRCAGVLYPPLFRNGIRVREYQRSLVRNKANRRRYVLVREGAYPYRGWAVARHPVAQPPRTETSADAYS